MEKFMKISKNNQYLKSLVLTDKLINLIEAQVKLADFDCRLGVILNFKDPEYSAESGGYHPVEIAINYEGEIQYITDFAYMGSWGMAELVKELDFDFSYGLFQHMGQDYPLDEGSELFKIWQDNFCSYHESEVYQVSLQGFL